MDEVTTKPVYRHTPDMGEISGFGGFYEEACQDMLEAGVRWLNEHPDADPQFSGYRNVFGLISEDNDDAKLLSQAVEAPVLGASGAMHHAVIGRLLFIKASGWDRYCEVMRQQNS